MDFLKADNPTKSLSRSGVVDAIRDHIINAEFAPGQRLVEFELCAMFGVSRGTIRTALMDLEHQGLVERIANRGARVRVVGINEALQIAEVRLAVETLCVMRAAERITDEQIQQMHGLKDQLQRYAAAGEIEAFAATTREVFVAYVEIADQPIAAEMLAGLRARNVRHRFRLTYRSGRAQVALPYWIEIIDAICAHDPDRAKLALERHSRNVQETMQALAADQRLLTYPRGGTDDI